MPEGRSVPPVKLPLAERVGTLSLDAVYDNAIVSGESVHLSHTHSTRRSMDELKKELAETFQQYSECGTPVMNLGAYQCRTETSSRKPHQQERFEAAAKDTRSPSDKVLIAPFQTNGGAYAYHEQRADGTLACGAPRKLAPDEYQFFRRENAKDRGRSPCQSCLKLTVTTD